MRQIERLVAEGLVPGELVLELVTELLLHLLGDKDRIDERFALRKLLVQVEFEVHVEPHLLL